MIVGTIALITMLFSGGVNEIFFIDKLEKGVKEFVIEKTRQKIILADLKTSKKFMGQFDKGRKSQLKELKELYKDQTTNDEDLQVFFDKLHKERLVFQERIIDDRLAIFNKIEADEWSSIIEYSDAKTTKRTEKELKKAKKSENKTAFTKTRKVIMNSVSDLNKQKAIIKGLDDMIDAFEGLGDRIQSINVKENKILIQKDASKEALKNTLNEMNSLRYLSFQQLVTFHSFVKKKSNKEEWDNIMKAFTKEMSLSTR